ncbi:CorA family divalent cation transporter [Arthrobacter liuii]
MVQTRLYRTGELEREDVAFNELDDLVRQEGVTVWVDYTSPTPDDLAGIEKVLGLHRLAVEDAVHDHQRPKLDRYPTHLFLAAYHAELGSDSDELKVSEIKALITKRALVTVHGPT